MRYNIWFDICSIGIILVILLIFFLRKYVRMFQNTVFMVMAVSVMADAVFDILAAMSDGHNAAVEYLFDSLYFVVNIFVAFLYALYILSVLSYHVDKNKVLRELAAPLLVGYGMLLFNPFIGWIFSISADITYHRGPCIWIMHIIYLYYAVYGIICMIKLRRQITREKMMLLIPFVFIISLAGVIEALDQYMLLQTFSLTLCLVILFFGMQNPEELFDGLTGLLNERAFTTLIGARLSAGGGFQCISVCIHDFDIARNTLSQGSLAVLIEDFVTYMKGYTKKCLVFRLGEGQYCIVPDDSSNDAAYDIFKQTVSRMERPFTTGKGNISFTSSCCMLECPTDASTVTGIVDVMHMAAAEGKAGNMAVVSMADLDLKHVDYMKDVDDKVRHALEDRQFEVYYQPIYSTKTGRYVAAEALLRMKDNKHGFISPDVFIPIAERNGMIIDIGRFVLEEVCRMMSEEHLDQYGLKYVEVNLSVVECIQDDIAENISGMLKKYALDTSCINLEITETAADSFTQIVDSNLSELHKEGFEFSLDDFGTGYSSINRILALPLRIIKLDKTIVQPAFENEDAKTLLNCSVDMVKKLGLEIVAEGVETREQADEIIRLGCDYIQGYYFSKPVPRDAFLKIIKESSLPEVYHEEY